MTMYTGLTGKLTVAVVNKDGVGTDKDVCYISNWSVEDTTDMIEFSQLGGGVGADAGYKLRTPGQQSWSASADGAVDFATGANQKTLFDCKTGRTEVRVKFYLDAEKDTYLEGYGYIESLSVDLSAEDKGNISVSINGNSHTVTETVNEKSVTKEYGLRLYVNGAPKG